MLTVHTTSKPEDIISKINDLIDDNVISDWNIDDEGDYILMSNKSNVWVRPVFDETDKYLLRFTVIIQKDSELTKDTYTKSLCKFAEMLLNNFDDVITDLSISPFSAECDNTQIAVKQNITDKTYDKTTCGQCGYFMRYKNYDGTPDDTGDCGSIGMNKQCYERANPFNVSYIPIIQVDENDESCVFFRNKKPTKRIIEYIKRHSNLYIQK